ncbi:multidrug effflux MFS transporter [Aestuariispira insulae]|uniref:Bcr/CflA family efflux transporter n=1 Tax=Aestuariispira insulae TaxID=1461337 RepID=A0A3D9HDY9_9PROT|nr:multidrug effflux MFS transporter [Aestuariispira insulae]RED47685.1 DHA1 family bicyclomycin/chloramphenicol resistance-like MFS transporter [Aestuariispira insulae]
MTIRPESLAITILLTMLTALGPISTDLYLPSLPSIQAAFLTDVPTVQLTLSVYLIAFAVCQLVYGPLSDRFGRRRVLILGVGIYAAASVACVFAQSVEQLVAARLFQALGGCSGVVVARAVVRDVYGATRAAKLLSYMGTAMALAPALGPILGGYLTVAFGWQANFVVLSIFGGACLMGLIFLLPETHHDTDPTAFNPPQMLRNFKSLLGHGGYRGYLFTSAFSYSGLFAFISGSSFVFIKVLGLTADQYGYCFAAIVLGYMAGTQIGGRSVTRFGIKAMVQWGAVISAVAGLAMAAFAIMGVSSVAAVLAPMILYMVGMGLVLPNSAAGSIGPFPKMAGAASSLLGFCQYSIAAAIGYAVGHAFNDSQIPMALAIAFMGLASFLCYFLMIRGVSEPAEEAV